MNKNKMKYMEKRTKWNQKDKIVKDETNLELTK